MFKSLISWIIIVSVIGVAYLLVDYAKIKIDTNSCKELEQNADVIVYGKILSIAQYNQPDYYLIYLSNNNQYLLYTKNSNIILSEIEHYINTKAVLRVVLDGERYSQVGNLLVKSIELVN